MDCCNRLVVDWLLDWCQVSNVRVASISQSRHVVSQSNYMAAFIIIGFLVFITLRGELQGYRSVLGI